VWYGGGAHQGQDGNFTRQEEPKKRAIGKERKMGEETRGVEEARGNFWLITEGGVE
jgi:hypothetical protein